MSEFWTGIIGDRKHVCAESDGARNSADNRMFLRHAPAAPGACVVHCDGQMATISAASFNRVTISFWLLGVLNNSGIPVRDVSPSSPPSKGAFGISCRMAGRQKNIGLCRLCDHAGGRRRNFSGVRRPCIPVCRLPRPGTEDQRALLVTGCHPVFHHFVFLAVIAGDLITGRPSHCSE